MNQIVVNSDASTKAKKTPAQKDVVAALRTLLGAEHVKTEAEDTVFYSTDIFVHGVPAEAVVAPGTVEELSAAVKLCTDANHAVIPRGGGFSYTQGYIPVVEGTVIFDLRRLNRIVEINVEDLYVTVECGCTWTQLYDALTAKGVRTPYFGPMSGYRSTVGGALSQGSFFLGSTEHGTTADTLLALDVVLADGTVLKTGSSAGTHTSNPYFKNYGPDLTGLFAHDAGALGMKARASLKLIPFPAHTEFATFAFDEQAPAARALKAITRTGIAGEAYIWDPFFGVMMRQQQNFKDQLKYLKGVVFAAGNPIKGFVGAMSLAFGGMRAFAGKSYLMHVTIDDPTAEGARAKLKLLRALAEKEGARPVEAAAPRALRGRPFNDFAAIPLAHPHNRSLPTHGIFPMSEISAVCEDVNAYFAAHSAEMEANGITVGTILFAVNQRSICCEPLFYWKDEQLSAHDRITNKSDMAVVSKFKERPSQTQAVAKLRKGLVELFTRHGASHCQIGKAYPYRQTRLPDTYKLLEDIKAAVDPKGLMNPGSLGLNPPT